jgi:hypothetical protein
MLLVIAYKDLRAEPDPVVADLTLILVQVPLQVSCDTRFQTVEVFL